MEEPNTSPEPSAPTSPAQPSGVMDVQAPVAPTEAPSAATDPGAMEGITPVTNDQPVVEAPTAVPAENPVTGQPPVPSTPKKSGSKMPIIVAIVVFLLLVAGVLVWHFTMHKDHMNSGNSEATNTSTSTSTTPKTTPKTTTAKASDVDSTVKSIDDGLKSIDDSKDFSSTDLSGTNTSGL